MHAASPLIALIVLGIGLSFVFGAIANRLRISTLVGYLLAGVAVGPFTPGFIADADLALQLAEIGVILLMFGVGLHFSVADLLAVKSVAVPGALAQTVLVAVLGGWLAHWLGWPVGGCAVFGLSLAVASTVVVMRNLQEHHLMETRRGHVAVGWLVTQDLMTVLALVLLPPLSLLLKGNAADVQGALITVGMTLGKVVAFIVLMLVLGRHAIPAVLHYVAHTGSRELFRLAVLSVALVVAFIATEVFGVSFALGAFVAGMVLSESRLAQRAAEESLPLREAFTVLFFVSVGMLFNPAVLLHQPLPLLAALGVVMLGTPLCAWAVVRLLGETTQTALVVGTGLAQIGEFSFILTGLGIDLGLLPAVARDVVLGTAIISILLNPLLFGALGWLRAHTAPRPVVTEPLPLPAPTRMSGHIVLVGYGRVGRLVVEGLQPGTGLFVIEAGDDLPRPLGDAAFETISGNAADARVLATANLAAARLLMVAIPDAFEAGQIVEQARAINPSLRIIARAHFDAAVEHLTKLGADVVIMGEREIAHAMLAEAVRLP